MSISLQCLFVFKSRGFCFLKNSHVSIGCWHFLLFCLPMHCLLCNNLPNCPVTGVKRKNTNFTTPCFCETVLKLQKLFSSSRLVSGNCFNISLQKSSVASVCLWKKVLKCYKFIYCTNKNTDTLSHVLSNNFPESFILNKLKRNSGNLLWCPKQWWKLLV